MRVRRTALGAATSECHTKPIAASFFGSGYNRLREHVAPPLPHWTFVSLDIPAIDRPSQRHQPLHQILRVNRFSLCHQSFPRLLSGRQSGQPPLIPVVQRR